jgi:hypothetical protein
MTPGWLPEEATLTAEAELKPLTDLPSSTPDRWDNGNPVTPDRGEMLAGLFPPAEIQIIQPGEGSRVSSPFETSVALNGVVAGPYRVELLGADGRLIYRQVWAAPPGSDPLGAALSDLFFHITIHFGLPTGTGYPGTEETRLVVTRLDAHDRIQAVNTVNLVLQSDLSEDGESGEGRLSPGNEAYFHQADAYTEIHIQEPSPGSLISAGELQVSGLKRTLQEADTSGHLFVELVAEDGRVVGQRVISVLPSSRGDHGEFSALIPYRVSDRTPVRLVVADRAFQPGNASPRPAYTHLSSLEIVLEP